MISNEKLDRKPTLIEDAEIVDFYFDLSLDSSNGLSMKADGTKLLLTTIPTQVIQEFSLSEPWDLSTLSLVRTTSTAGVASTPYGLYVEPTGSNVFVTDWSAKTTTKFTTLSPWSAVFSLATVYTVASGSDLPMQTLFDTNGTTAYIFFLNRSTVDVHTLGTAYDLDSSTNMSTFDMAALDAGVMVSANYSVTGDYLLISDFKDEKNIKQYSLSTPYDVTTAEKVSERVETGEPDFAQGTWNNEEPSFFFFDSASGRIQKLGYKLVTNGSANNSSVTNDTANNVIISNET